MPAQVFDLEKDRVALSELKGFWRFHTGDDPDGKLGWASPALDDSSWNLLRSDQPWSDQGYKGYGGFAWYRFQVVLPASHPPLALCIPMLSTSYQVFAEGRLIGKLGGMPPHQTVQGGTRNCDIIPIPADVEPRGIPLTIAIRVWHWPHWAYNLGGPTQPVLIGDTALLNKWRSFQLSETFRSSSAEIVLLIGAVLAGVAGLGLFLLRSREREYLWFSAYEFANAALCAWTLYRWFYAADFQRYYAAEGLIVFAQGTCSAMFLVTLLKERRGWCFWLAIGSILACTLLFLPLVLGWMSIAASILLICVAFVPFFVGTFLMLVLAARRGNLDARMLAGPVGLSFGSTVLGGLLMATVFSISQNIGVLAFRERYLNLITWPFPISSQNVADFLCQISILAILVLRFARTRRDEERHASELEAAQSVQQVLIPDECPAVPGFNIESSYIPASEVGGDFFQILPAATGGTLVVIGDVSGKGMAAAMTVSLLVGTVRTMAHFEPCPGQILAAMNQRLLGRQTCGFTTCLVIKISLDGELTAANAGHLAPYLNGTELEIPGGLPLGLAPDAEYPEQIFSLGPSDRLTLLTDGVVEARNQKGELFGFERTQAISCASAKEIARAAQAFGQEDDITVLSFTSQLPQREAITMKETVPLSSAPT
ncbi:MAG TPA: SpoIIE family protein phosphatase [Terracidiphilus sp.]|jgi:hypothetical protein